MWVAIKAREDVGWVEWRIVGGIGNCQLVGREVDVDEAVGLVVPNGVHHEIGEHASEEHVVAGDSGVVAVVEQLDADVAGNGLEMGQERVDLIGNDYACFLLELVVFYF